VDVSTIQKVVPAEKKDNGCGMRGTRFPHPNFKKVLAEAKPEDTVTFMSVVDLPAARYARRG
jgi:hypothetical protein